MASPEPDKGAPPTPENNQPAKPSSSETASKNNRRMPLVTLVTLGTIVVTVVGIAVFLWLAWLLSHQPAPLRGDSGWWDWLEHVDGSGVFDAARTTATVLAIVGVGGAALVAYRRQDTAERAHEVAIEGQRIANAQHTLDSHKYQLDRERHNLETHRRRDDREKDLRARFAAIAEQLGSSNFAVRHAAAYALASLADDWHDFEKDDERQVCVDLLCAQLRRPRTTIKSQIGIPSDLPPDAPAQDLEVRRTMIALLKARRGLKTDSAAWSTCSIDLGGADLVGADFYETDLRSANLVRADLAQTNMMRMKLMNADLRQAHLSASDFSRSDMTKARLWRVRVDKDDSSYKYGTRVTFHETCLRNAQFLGAYLPRTDFSKADLTNARMHGAELYESSFSAAKLTSASFSGAVLRNSDFSKADLRGTSFAGADIEGCLFADALHDEETHWPNRVPPDGINSD